VCGGGRYDDLVRALGARESVPACGFSYGLERLDLVRGGERQDVPAKARVLVVPVTAADHRDALQVAQQVRSLGRFTVEQDLRLRGPKAALRHADRTDVRAVLLLGERERAEGVVVLRDMRTREERRVRQADLAQAMEALDA
jgi:histidyl-tRNA synthetase